MKLNVVYNEVDIMEKYCFKCGSNINITKHHALPKHMKPKKNVLIPLCRECHTFIHSQEMGTMKSFLYKIQKSLDAVKNIFSRKQKIHDEITIGDIIKKGKK